MALFLVFSKPTEFETFIGVNGKPYTRDNAYHVASFYSDKPECEVIQRARSYCVKEAVELGSVRESSIQQTGFYAGAYSFIRDVYRAPNK